MKKGKSKRVKVWYFIKTAYLPFYLYLFTFTLSASAEPLAETQARLGAVTGDVQVLSAGAREWAEAGSDLIVEAGDRIRTAAEGEAELLVAKGALVVLQANSELHVEQNAKEEDQLTLSKGSLLGKVKGDADSSRHYVFHTPTAVCAVRGTEFGLEVSENQETHLGVFEGEMKMGPAGRPLEQAQIVRAHEEGVLQHGRPFKRLHSFSSRMQSHYQQRFRLRQRHAELRNRWIPHTVPMRQELRQKWRTSPPPPPPRNVPSHLPRHRRPRHSDHPFPPGGGR